MNKARGLRPVSHYLFCRTNIHKKQFLTTKVRKTRLLDRARRAWARVGDLYKMVPKMQRALFWGSAHLPAGRG